MSYCARRNLTDIDLDYLHRISFEKSWTWWFNHIGTFLVFLIGVCGNILCLGVLCRRPLIRHSYTQYLITLAIVDTGAIFSETLSALNELYQYRSVTKQALIQHTNLSCKLFYYIRFVFYTMSSWIVVALAIERLVAIKFPLWSKFICTVTNARRIILSIVLFTMFIQSYQLIIKGLDCSSSSLLRSNKTCRCKTLRHYAKFDILFTIYIWRLVLMTLIPITIIITVNALIVNKLSNEKSLINHSSIIDHGRHKIILLYKISRMLVIVSSIYLLLHVPGSTLEIIKFLFIHAFQSCHMKWQYYIYITQDIFDLLTNLNYGINFYLYIISGKHIRREFLRNHGLARLSIWKEKRNSQQSSFLSSSTIPYSTTKRTRSSVAKSMQSGIRSSV